MRRRRKISKGGAVLRNRGTMHTLTCSTKGCTRQMKVDSDIVSVVCWECVQKKVGIDPKYLRPAQKPQRKTEEGFPRGWHLYKRFVHPDGRVFDKGKENTKLKGTLPATVVKVNTLSKTERRRLREAKQLRREARLAKKYAKKMKKMKEQEND